MPAELKQEGEQNVDKVLITYLPLQSVTLPKGARIAHIMLNKPKALNALDLDMVEIMLDALAKIREDDSVVAVLLDSHHEKAFCAGGDIVSMYQAMKHNIATKTNPQHGSLPEDDINAYTCPAFLRSFFTQEYRLDYCIHRFPKPIIVWGNGIIMGGGLGLFMGSHIRLVTETSRIAMPEITIGLFPDVGGSYFLNKLPPGVGLFLGLTAANLNARDTHHLGMADAIVANSSKAQFIDALCALSHISKDSVLDLANSFAPADGDLRESNIERNLKLFERLSSCSDIRDVQASLEALAEEQADNAFIIKALKSFKQGSPITAHLVFEQLARAKHLSLAQCFEMELSMAHTCGTLGEFQEGVRALLIDKDNDAKWLYPSIDDVPKAVINAHFNYFTQSNAQASAPHPLAKLEQEFG
ncbi:enoyl-CoA hydratase/isomerase family protein [Glaciecola siphonariae]|uniref:3-hydroxyisobutyryl-CoA hydrolase n=1 Tax=Glaciecola siphonariae TaxID=521012 RepID=A0ABV9LRR8_9ALTE